MTNIVNLPFALKPALIASAVDALVQQMHGASDAAGWWTNKDGSRASDNPLSFSNKTMLVVTELAEAVEGDRKGIPDQHLPQYPNRLVELADAWIRIGDQAGEYEGEFSFGEIVAAKMAFNAKRADHTPEARAAAGGKKY